MIIKLIPENDIEKAKMKTVEHRGVKEFLIFGAKNIDGEMIDFHDWTGDFRYLIGSASYFTQVLVSEMNHKKEEERRKEGTSGGQKAAWIKRSNPSDGEIKQILDAQEITQIANEMNEKQGNSILEFPKAEVENKDSE
jgi:hypothetical protein